MVSPSMLETSLETSFEKQQPPTLPLWSIFYPKDGLSSPSLLTSSKQSEKNNEMQHINNEYGIQSASCPSSKSTLTNLVG